MAFTLPELGYSYDALERHFDKETMEIHHSRHHQAYVNNANGLLEGTQWADKSAEEVIANLDQIPADKRTGVRNNAGGHANHFKNRHDFGRIIKRCHRERFWFC